MLQKRSNGKKGHTLSVAVKAVTMASCWHRFFEEQCQLGASEMRASVRGEAIDIYFSSRCCRAGFFLYMHGGQVKVGGVNGVIRGYKRGTCPLPFQTRTRRQIGASNVKC